MTQNRSTGAGTHQVGLIEIKSMIKWNADSTFVLAAVSGIYSPPPLPSNPQDKNFSNELWYVLNIKDGIKVVGIRDPKKFHPGN